jgi:hypothetical protein
VADSVRVVTESRAVAFSLDELGNFAFELVDHLVQEDIRGKTSSTDRVAGSRPEHHDAASTVRSCPRPTPSKPEGRAAKNRGIDAN